MTQANLDTMSREQLMSLVVQMVAKQAAAAQRKLSCKVSEKGAVCVYGLGRYPVTLYLSQWEKLIEFIKSGAVQEFIDDNRAALSVKD